MKIVRIVHTADLHLGSHYSSTPEIAQERKQEQLENLREIIGICKDRDTDILLIAGDMFDSVRVDPQLLAEVQDLLEDSGMDVFISPGNHDPVVPDSCYNDPDWPLNVHIFKGALESVEIPEKGVCVWGVGFTRSNEVESLLPKFKPGNNMINILVMHAEFVRDEATEGRYNPVTLEELRSLDVDYCALGHIHNISKPAAGEYKFLYSGCPFGRGFDEYGEKGVIAGHVGRGFAHMEFVPCSSRRYCTERIDVTGCEVADEYANIITSTLKRNYGDSFERNIYDITLSGELAKGIMPDLPLIRKRLMESMYYIRLTDMTTTELDIDALMKDGSLRGAFVRTIISRMNSDNKNRDKYLRALLYGLRAFDGEVRINEDY